MSTEDVDKLEQSVSATRRTIASDGYPISLGELTNMYRDGELIIRPEFQRFFRWSKTQKSRLIESILLGIPLPSIFVSQREDGKWELVDGLQRMSTMLEFQGELVEANGTKKPQLELVATKFLPQLEGRVWESVDKQKTLSSALRLDFKRSKIDVKIIKRESSPETKYDLFQRLNSYGSAATAQELRSALLVAASPEFFAWIEELASYPAFVAATDLSQKSIDERYDLELVLRFLVLHARPTDQLSETLLRDFPLFVDNESLKLVAAYPGNKVALEGVFRATFDEIAANGGKDLLRRWDSGKGEFVSRFLNTAFELVALGIGFHLANGKPVRANIAGAVKELWDRAEMQPGFATGKSTEWRIAQYVPAGRELFEA